MQAPIKRLINTYTKTNKEVSNGFFDKIGDKAKGLVDSAK